MARVLNILRETELPLTLAEYQLLGIDIVIERLLARDLHWLASKVHRRHSYSHLQLHSHPLSCSSSIDLFLSEHLESQSPRPLGLTQSPTRTSPFLFPILPLPSPLLPSDLSPLLVSPFIWVLCKSTKECPSRKPVFRPSRLTPHSPRHPIRRWRPRLCPNSSPPLVSLSPPSPRRPSVTIASSSPPLYPLPLSVSSCSLP